MAGKSGRSINNVPESPIKHMIFSWEGILVVLFILVNIFCKGFSEYYNLENLLRQMPVYLAEVFLMIPMAYILVLGEIDISVGATVCHEINDKYGFAEICQMAEEAKDFPSRVDANDECFLAPENMTEEVKDYCRRTGQKVPETLGEVATVIYTSLAECYAKTAKELEEMTGRTYSRIHVVGGGSNAGYLNELTAKATGKKEEA